MKRIGVLRGGTGDEYFFSLESGARISEALRKEGYDVLVMLVDKEGILHIKGIPTAPQDIHEHVDAVWNSLHGGIGEDGTIQELFDKLGIAYTGSRPDASRTAIDKLAAKERAKQLGIKTPESILVMPEGGESIAEITQNIYKRMAPPWVVKPLKGGASVHTYFAFTPLELSQFVEESVSHREPFIVEQYIYGKEASVGVIDNFRGQETYVLPVVELKSTNRGVLTTDARTTEDHAVVSGSLRSDEKERLSKLAKDMHATLGASDYSQSEFIVDKQGKIWYIETDTSPHMHTQSAFVKALHSVGSSLGEFVRSVLKK